jgi:hypothetical protein
MMPNGEFVKYKRYNLFKGFKLKVNISITHLNSISAQK